MRSIWRGAVSFGLVSIGVKLYTATEDHDIRFNQVHAVDGGRIKCRRVCSIDGAEVEYSEIAKGYELPDGQLVVLTDEDFEELPLASRREIEVLQFVDQDEIDPIQYEKTYYLEPDPSAARPYVLLRDALENAGRVAITKIAKGYELPDGQLVVLTDEDFEELPLASRREIEVLQFVDQDEIDPIQYEKTYYLEPDPSAARPYVLLRDALENAGRVAITKIAIRS